MLHFNSRADIGSRVQQINRLYFILQRLSTMYFLLGAVVRNSQIYLFDVEHYSDPRSNCMIILGAYATHSSQLLWVRRIDRELGPFSVERNMILCVSNNLIVLEIGSTDR